MNITDSGPDSPLPVGGAFYLAGTAEDGVTDVVPVFVRTGVRTIIGTTGPSCAAFAAAARAFADGKGGTSDTIVFSKPGEAVAGDVWAHERLDVDTPVFIPSRWKSASSSAGASTSSSASTTSATGSAADGGTKGTPYQILVPQDPFFNSSGAYCLLVYKTKHEQKKDTTTIKNALLAYAASTLSCEDSVCRASAKQSFEKARVQAVALLPAGSQKDLTTAANALISTAETQSTTPASASSILGSMAAPTGSGVTLPVPPPDPQSAPYRNTDLAKPPARSTDWLAIGTMRLLAEQGGLLSRVAGGRVSYYSIDGSIQVKYLRILSDNDTIEVAGDPKSANPRSRATTGVKASGLIIGPPDQSGKAVTLRDLLEVLHGNVRIGTRYFPASAARDQLSHIMQPSADTPLTDDDQTVLDGLKVWAYGLAHAIERLLAQAAIAPPAYPQSPGEQALGDWLKDLLVPCAAAPLVSWARDPSVCGAPAPGSAPPWPGYAVVGNNPFEFLGSAIGAYETARADWAEKVTKVTFTLDRASTLTSVFKFNVQFTQSTWVFSYVTPVTGAAFVMDGSNTFSLFYLGAQLHLVPNPVDSPQWTQPNDWLRAFALELGMSTAGGSFGPASRFSGWKGLPAIFVGLALHAVPYTSFSIGGTLLDRRSSTVTQEEPHTFFGLYLGANVQVNIPDLVVALKGRTSSTTTASTNP